MIENEISLQTEGGRATSNLYTRILSALFKFEVGNSLGIQFEINELIILFI